ncbi:MAG TPA: hypothetical protein VMS17_13315 [Gemmataceae bacterium]|nr:hypothetical protein [Gemmataceae bacterium]
MTTATAAAPTRLLTTGEIARALALPEWRVRRFVAACGLAIVARLGTLHGVAEADLPALREAMAAAGIVQPAAEERPPEAAP